MAAPIVDHDSALEVSLEHNTFTGTKVEAHPLTAFLAPEYAAFQAKWLQVKEKEILLSVAISRAAAKIVIADDLLDSLVDRISNAILAITGSKDAPLYQLYFQNKTPSERRRGVLGPQLEAMRGWVASLKASPHASLQALGAELEAAVAKADQAVEEYSLAKTANREFRTIGERRALVDEFNAMQKRNSGKIAELPHTDAGKGLPNTFQDGFFKRARRSDGEKEMSKEDLLIAISESEIRAADLKEKLSELMAAEKASEEAKKTLAGKQSKVDELAEAAKKAQADLDAAKKELEAELKK